MIEEREEKEVTIEVTIDVNKLVLSKTMRGLLCMSLGLGDCSFEEIYKEGPPTLEQLTAALYFLILNVSGTIGERNRMALAVIDVLYHSRPKIRSEL